MRGSSVGATGRVMSGRTVGGQWSDSGEKKSQRALWRIVCEGGLGITRKQCQEYFQSRQARTGNIESIRAYVEARMGGRDALWRSIQEDGLPYSRAELQSVLEAISREQVDYTALAAVAVERSDGEELYELQHRRGLTYTRRQVAEYEQNFLVRDMSELRSFVHDHPGRRDDLWLLLRESGSVYSRRDLDDVLREMDHEVVDYSSLGDCRE